MRKTKYLIIGAGISGLTFANYAKSDYLIIEKEKEAGGFCRTIKRNGFVWDYAGHFFHFQKDYFRQFFLSKINEEDIIYNNKCTKILYKNKFIDFPFQTNIHQLSKSEFIDCLYDLFNKTEKDKYDNFLDMLYGKFGKSIVEKFLKPYNEKLYAVDLKKLDVDAMGRFFPYADKDAIIKNMKESYNSSYNNSFLYPKNGASSFINILLSNICMDNLLLDTYITKIDIKNKTALLSNGEEISYKYLVNTMPLNRFAELLDKNSELVDYLTYNKVLVLNLGFDKPSPLCKEEHWIYNPNKNCNYYRAGFYNNILNTKELSMYIEIGYNMDENISKNEIQKQLNNTLINLKKERIIDDTMNLIDWEPIIMDPAYVHISKKSIEMVDKYKNYLKQNDIYSIGRYGAWIYNSMEDSMDAARNLAIDLNNE